MTESRCPPTSRRYGVLTVAVTPAASMACPPDRAHSGSPLPGVDGATAGAMLSDQPGRMVRFSTLRRVGVWGSMTTYTIADINEGVIQ